uniref:Uncharacterized protein n=1 Tax=Anopheles farauti TaxID=69004 RepID=A0A182QI45_9DIPT
MLNSRNNLDKMKAKAAKKDPKSDKNLLSIKKVKTDIKKAKKSQKEVKPAVAKVAAKAAGASVAAATTAPLTFAEKKALSVKRKANIVSAPETKTIAAPKPAKTKPVAAAKKSPEKQAKPGKQPIEKKKKKKLVPLGTVDVEKKQSPAKKDKFKRKKKELQKKTPVTTQNNRKAQLKSLKKKEQKEGGVVVQQASAATLALVPQQLVSEEMLKKCFQVLHKKVAEGKDNLFGGEMVYGLQITAVKMPKVPLRNNRISLPHSLVHKDDEVCLIVKDQVRGRKVDYDRTLQHWEDKLKKLDLKQKVEIIPFRLLKQDYCTFEMRRKLMYRYQHFLCDARIVGHVFMFLGAVFIKRCKNPIPVKIGDGDDIKQSIEKSLLVQTYGQSNIGLSTMIKFATHWMPEEHVLENGMAVIDKLKTVYPGGWLNVQSLHITTTGEKVQSLPLYISTINPNLVPVPVVEGPREKFIKKQQYMLQKRTGGAYVVTKDGVVRKASDESDDEIVLEEYEKEEDDNWLPYDSEPPKRRRSSSGRPHKSLVLSSVYDAIRGNSIDSAGDTPSAGEDSRNKRNVRYYTYDDPQNDDLYPGYGEIVHPPQGPGSSVKLCKPEPPPAVQSISISDHSWSGIGSSIIHLLKYLIAGLAVLTLPVLLLQAFILPLKILMGLKSVAVANTLVLGTFLWKYLNRNRLRDDDEDEDGDEQSGSTGTAGTGGDGGGNGVLNGNDNRFFPFRAEDFENMTEEEIKTALKLLLKRNKRWIRLLAAEQDGGGGGGADLDEQDDLDDGLDGWLTGHGPGATKSANMTKKSLRKPIMVLRSRKTAIIKDGVITTVQPVESAFLRVDRIDHPNPKRTVGYSALVRNSLYLCSYA